MRLFIHALGASAGGGLTYLRNLIPHLAAKDGVQIELLAGGAARGTISLADNVEMVESKGADDQGTLARFWWEQNEVPKLIRRTGSDVLLSTGNFAIWNSRVPQ